jgi:hypothetical protein
MKEKSRGQISEVRSHSRINFDIRSAWPHKLRGTARATKHARFNVARLDWVPGIPDEPPFNLRLAKKNHHEINRSYPRNHIPYPVACSIRSGSEHTSSGCK